MISWFYLRDERKFPVACVAVHLAPGANSIYYAVSTHNPIDPYSRAIARSVALGRLKANYSVIEVPVTGEYLTRREKFRVCKEIVMNNHLPRRTRDAAWGYLLDSPTLPLTNMLAYLLGMRIQRLEVKNEKGGSANSEKNLSE